jgi:nucleolar protein 16
VPSRRDPLAIGGLERPVLSEARVERDADGKIIRVLDRTAFNPLNDPLNEFDSDADVNDVDEEQHDEEWGGIDDGGEGQTEIVKSLMAEARNEAPKRPRHQSEREREWLERLVAKHGDNTAAMARDRKLNPMQQTAADIGRRIKKMNS